MNIFTSLRIAAASTTVLVLAACGGAAEGDGAAPAASDEPAAIGERQANFEAIGDAFKAIRGQLEGTPDLALIEASANDINDRAQKITGLFPEGTGMDAGYDTEALATIWEQPEEFGAAAQKLVDASADLAASAAAGDAAVLGEKAKAMGATCGGCHDKFRVDDD